MASSPHERRSRHRYTYEEYLAYEQDSGLKHEFDDGEITALAGGSCRSLGCNHLQSVSHRGSPVAFHRGGGSWPQMAALPSIPSLVEYVLVSQTHSRVECFRRLSSGAWEYRDYAEGAVQLQSGARLDLQSLYADLPD